MSEEIDVYIGKLLPIEGNPGKDYFDGGALISFFRRSMPLQDEIIDLLLLAHRWTVMPNTRQQFVLSEQEALRVLREALPASEVVFQEQGWSFQAIGHSEDEGAFDIRRFLR